jgi:hypothetical protein
MNKSNYNSLGAKTGIKFAKHILSNMRIHNLKLNLKNESIFIADWSVEEILQILQNNTVYSEKTVIGTLNFPVELKNGYFNTATFDRIDNNKGYERDNYVIKPHFLNVEDKKFNKFNSEDFRLLVLIREQKQNLMELGEITDILNNDCTNFFYKLASTAKGSSVKSYDRKPYDFKTIKECVKFLIEKYIEQGGRCAYTNIPIYPISEHRYRISIERKNPLKGYTRDNIILIVGSLNFSPPGQIYNKNISEEQREIALKAAIFNQEYWDQCTLLTSERAKKCTEAKEYGKNMLSLLCGIKNVFKEMDDV